MITHSWNGTVLTITSDSGTSSADLQGEMGVRGPQGPAGGAINDVSLIDKTLTIENYAADAKAVGDALAAKADNAALGNLVVNEKQDSPVVIDDLSKYGTHEITSFIELTQEGSGDPLPNNIRPIIGHSEVQLNVSGKNLCSLATIERIEDKDYWNWERPVPFEGSLQAPFTISCDYSQADTSASQFDEGAAIFELTIDGEFVYVSGCDFLPNAKYGNGYTVTSGTLTKIEVVNWCAVTGTIKIQLEAGTTATPWEPHRNNTYTMDLGQTVGKGSLNWATGTLTIDWFFEELDGVEKKFYNKSSYGASGDYYRYAPTHYPTQRTIQGNMLCSHLKNVCNEGAGLCYIHNANIICNINGWTNLDDANTWLVAQKNKGTPFQLCYELQEPITIQLTPQQIELLRNTSNAISSNTGETKVIYGQDVMEAIQDAQKQNEWELIETITIAEEGLNSIIKTSFPDGTPYNLSAVKILTYYYYPMAASYETSASFYSKGVELGYLAEMAYQRADNQPSWKYTILYKVVPDAGVYEFISAAGSQGGSLAVNYPPNGLYQAVPTSKKIDAIKYYMWNNTFPVGAQIEIWGVRA